MEIFMKRYFFLFFSFFLSNSAFALEITHPFYITPVQKTLSETQFIYRKFHLKNSPNKSLDYRTRDILLAQRVSYGIAPKVAIEAQLSNAWNRTKYDVSSYSDSEDTNINWNLGATYDLYKENNLYLQSRLLYLQEETHHSNGAYKAFNALLKTGYDFNYILPYAGINIELPLFQSKYADNDPKYNVSLGLYKKISSVAVDLSMHYNYDEHWKSKIWYGDVYFYTDISSYATCGIYFSYIFDAQEKNNVSVQGNKIGMLLKYEF